MSWNVSWKFSKSEKFSITLILFFFTLSAFDANAQRSKADSVFLNSPLDQIETIKMVSEQDPNKAAMLSAVLPGLGQAYNNQYWKIPLIYGGGMIIGHYIHYNDVLFNEFRNALIAVKDNNPNTTNPYSQFSDTSLQRNRDAFHKNRDMLILVGAAFYLLNIVDAHVSAHLHEFEVNDNLALKVSPTIQTTPVLSQSSPVFSRTLGVSLSLRIK